MIPQHVLEYWRQQGKDEDEILQLQQSFTDDVAKRIHRDGISESKKQDKAGDLHLLEQALEMHKDWKSLRFIANTLDTNYWTVRQVLLQSPEYNPARDKEERNLNIKRDYVSRDDLTEEKIGEKYGITGRQVRTICKGLERAKKDLTKRFVLRLPDWLFDEISQLAQQNGQSINSEMIDALKSYIEKL